MLWHRRQEAEDQDQEPELCAEWRKAWKYVQRKTYALNGLEGEKEEKEGELDNRGRVDEIMLIGKK